VRLLRLLNLVLLFAAVLAVSAGLASFSPLVQTWIAGRLIAHTPGLSGSLDWASAGFGKAEVSNLRLLYGGAVLSAPSVKVHLPVTAAVIGRGLRLESLEATDWTLDLTKVPATRFAAANPVLAAARMACLTMRAWDLPRRLSVADLNLEGDVVAPAAQGLGHSRYHVAIRGGGLAGGREGTFTIDVTGGEQGGTESGTARARLVVALDGVSRVSRILLTAGVPRDAGYSPVIAGVDLSIEATREAGGEGFALRIAREGRLVAQAQASLPDATRRLGGAWTLDLGPADLALLAGSAVPGSGGLKGRGDFSVADDFGSFRLQGRLSGDASSLGSAASPLARFGTVRLDADFEAEGNGKEVRVTRAKGDLEGTGLSATIASTGELVYDGQAGSLQAPGGSGDWMRVTAREIDLGRLPPEWGGGLFSAGSARGGFTIGGTEPQLRLRASGPLVLTGVVLAGAGGRLGSLALSGIPAIDLSEEAWSAACRDVTVAAEAGPVASGSVTLTGARGDSPALRAEIKGAIELGRLGGIGLAHGLERAGLGHAAVEGTVTLVPAAGFEGKVILGGKDSRRSIQASITLTPDGQGGVSFSIPFTIRTEEGASEMTLSGLGAGVDSGFDAKLTGAKADLAQLRLVALVLAAAGGGGDPAIAGIRDRSPFWGDGAGHLRFSFEKVAGGTQPLERVEGAIEMTPGSLRLTGFHADLPQKVPLTAEASVGFDPAAPAPYRLAAHVTVARVDGAEVLGRGGHGIDPPLDGHFAVERDLAGTGLNGGDLLAGCGEKIRITSTPEGGILRLLATQLDDAIPERQTPVRDTLGDVGSAVGAFFGAHKENDNAGAVRLGRQAQAVLDCADHAAELAYDSATLEVERAPDGSLRLSGIELTGPELHVSGTGLLLPGTSLPAQRPLSADLTLAAKGRLAELMAAAGLLSKDTDALGYTRIAGPLHFGGTPSRVDARAWHDLLARSIPPAKAAK
jgi:hypothetical protein